MLFSQQPKRSHSAMIDRADNRVIARLIRSFNKTVDDMRDESRVGADSNHSRFANSPPTIKGDKRLHRKPPGESSFPSRWERPEGLQAVRKKFCWTGGGGRRHKRSEGATTCWPVYVFSSLPETLWL